MATTPGTRRCSTAVRKTASRLAVLRAGAFGAQATTISSAPSNPIFFSMRYLLVRDESGISLGLLAARLSYMLRRRTTSMSDLRVGIVGLGWAAGAHIEAFKHVQGATVTAVCARRRHDPADLEKSFGVPLEAYDDFDRMLADKTIDIVDICSPPWLHARQAIAAARAG